MYPRFVASAVQDALSDTPVVLIVGARQSGKSTLARHVRGGSAQYFTLDDIAFRSAISRDPDGVIANLPRDVVIDEIQLAPQIFRSIKASVDRDRAPGRFLLTGSANVLLLPKLSDSLAGRMEIITLWPLSQGEIGSEADDFSIAKSKRSFIDLLLAEEFEPSKFPKVIREDLASRIVLGGFPEPLQRAGNARRSAWFSSFIDTILQRDVREISNIVGINELPTLLSLLAARTANLANYSDISRAIGVPWTTLSRYLSLLRAIYLIHEIPAWSSNIGLRMVRSPKLHICDTGLAANLIKFDTARLLSNGPMLGQLLETFVTMELLKMLGWSLRQPRLYHFRTQNGIEVDIVLELPTGEVYGIEVKAASSITANDFRGLQTLRDKAREKFMRGVVLYGGERVLPFGHQLLAVPVSALWSVGE